jgi:hypothetical protein
MKQERVYWLVWPQLATCTLDNSHLSLCVPVSSNDREVSRVLILRLRINFNEWRSLQIE